MALIIEELNRSQRVQARYRMDGERFTLGRAYHNDVILDDPHADPRHAEVVRDEDGGYTLRDLHSANGSQLLGNNRDKSVKAGAFSERTIESGDEIQLGKTHLRFTDSEARVAPALPLHSLERLFERLSHPAAAFALLFTVGLSTLAISYLGYARSYEWTLAANLVAGSVVGLLVYAAAWAFIGRVVRHETRFFTHLSIAALGALLYATWEWFGGLLDFNYALGNWKGVLDLLVLALLLPAMLWCACFLAMNLSPRWRWGVALLLPWSFLGLGMAEDIGGMRDFSALPEISTEIKYEDMLWREPVPMQQFIAGSPALFDIPLDKKARDEDEAEDEVKDASEQQSPTGQETETES